MSSHAAIEQGSRFGSWVVLDPKKSGLRVRCVCDCGTERMVNIYNLRDGKTQSCGCAANLGQAAITHGLSGTAEYGIWKAMKARCYNPKHKNFADYGGRGIKVCSKWIDSPEVFIADMGERPSSLHSIDRIDCNGDYSPDNCRWATQKAQTRNTRRSVVVEHNGEAKTVAEWADLTGIKDSTLYHRLYLGWSVERTLTTPARPMRMADAQTKDGRLGAE